MSLVPVCVVFERMRVVFGVVLSVLVLCGEVCCLTSITSTREAIVFGKTNDVVVIGLFGEGHEDSRHVFVDVSKEWPKGVAFGVADNPSQDILDRYEVTPPAVVLYRSFTDQGVTKRGKKQRKVFDTSDGAKTGTGGSTDSYPDVAAFVLAQGVPVVVKIPANLGPDYSARAGEAQGSPWPRLLAYSSSSHSSDVKEFLGPACERLRNDYRAAFFCFLLEVDPSADAEYVEGMLGMGGLDPDDYDGTPQLVAVAADGTQDVWPDGASKLEEAVARGKSTEDEEVATTDEAVTGLVEHVSAALVDAPEFPLIRSPPSARKKNQKGKGKGGGKKKKSKGKKKKGGKKKKKSSHDEL